MRRTIGGLAACVIGMHGAAGGAWAAGCASGSDAAALKVAALQQELMVAAYSCHDVSLYNGFVLSHQPELIASDGRLKSYFVHLQGGEAGYHTYKTELANDAALQSSRDGDDFCARAGSEFSAVASLDSVASCVDAHDFRLADDVPVCAVPVVRSAARYGGDEPATYSAPAPHRPMDASADDN